MKGITIILLIILAMTSNPIMAQQKIVQPLARGTKVTQTAGRDQLGDFAPEFARLNDDILFGEVWSRNDLLSLRDRSLVTITSLISQGRRVRKRFGPTITAARRPKSTRPFSTT